MLHMTLTCPNHREADAAFLQNRGMHSASEQYWVLVQIQVYQHERYSSTRRSTLQCPCVPASPQQSVQADTWRLV